MLIKQLINPRKVKTEKLKFRTNLCYQVMDCWSVTQYMIVYKGRLLKKSSNCKSKSVLSTLVSTLLSNIAFHLLLIWLHTLVAIGSVSRLTSFPSLSFCTQQSEVALLFNLNLSRLPFLRQVVDLDLLLCIGFNLEHVVLFLCHSSTQRPMNDWKIERSNGCSFGWQQLIANSIEIFISRDKKNCNLVDSWTESVLQEW